MKGDPNRPQTTNRQSRGLMAYLEAMLRALAQKRLMRKNQIGPGEYKTPVPRPDSGEKLREIRATHGVGRPIPIKAIIGDDELAHVVTAERTVAEIAAWQPTSEHNMARDAATVCAAAVTLHGSQKKAAAALGISVGKLRRSLRRG